MHGASVLQGRARRQAVGQGADPACGWEIVKKRAAEADLSASAFESLGDTIGGVAEVAAEILVEGVGRSERYNEGVRQDAGDAILIVALDLGE